MAQIFMRVAATRFVYVEELGSNVPVPTPA